MNGLAHVEPAEHRVPRVAAVVGFGQPPLLARRSRPTRTPAPAATLRADHASGSGLYQRSLAPAGPGDNTPRSSTTGATSHARTGGLQPLTGVDQKGNGGLRSSRGPICVLRQSWR